MSEAGAAFGCARNSDIRNLPAQVSSQENDHARPDPWFRRRRARALTLSSLDLGPAQAAAGGQPQVQADTLDPSALRRHYRANDLAALRMFGAVAGTIVGIAAAEQARRYWRRHGYYGYGGYGYPQPPVYYGYGLYFPH